MGTGRIDGHGHVGLVSGYKKTISASSVTGTVVEMTGVSEKRKIKMPDFTDISEISDSPLYDLFFLWRDITLT